MDTSFVHLHCHSNFSLLDGVAGIDELINKTVTFQMKALALTDHNTVSGAVEFYEKAKEKGVYPVIGSEITLDDDSSVILLVKNKKGYANLCRIITEGKLKKGHLTFILSEDKLLKYREGLILLSGGRKGKITQLLKNRKGEEASKHILRLKKFFGEDFFIELHYFSAEDKLTVYKLYELARLHSVPVVASNDVHLLNKEKDSIRRALQAISRNTTLEKLVYTGSSEQYFKSSSEMAELFKRYPEAIRNTCEIVKRCKFDFSLGKPVFPVLDLPEGETTYSLLWKKCFEGLKKKYNLITEDLINRLVYELKTIKDLGFSDYFLIVKDIVEYCVANAIPCIGRGSAADSLVSYVLDITKVDPIRYNLYFERFLNPGRKEPPDIDLDICWKRRDDVLDYIYKKYGHDKTAMICTFNTFKIRSAVGDVAKTFGLPEEEIRSLTKSLLHQGVERIDDILKTVPECNTHPISGKTYREILEISKIIGNFPRYLSVHLGGVIIAPDEITKYTPLEESGKGLIISQFDMHSIEKLGLVKMDILGVRMLSVLSDCLKTTEVDNYDMLPEDDKPTIKMIMEGETIGCFQLESPGMRSLLKKMKIENMDDIIAAISVIRPGPAEGGMKDLYIKRRAGLEKVGYPHPCLEPVLRETYGIVLYQEQVMMLAHAAAGFTLSEADLLRRAMTKSRDKKAMLSIKKKFIKGALGKGMKESEAEKIWKLMESFVGYGFNKAHSATYGMIAYHSAYMKKHYPVAFMTAVLNNYGGFYSMVEYIEECRRLGITISAPDVNVSQKEFIFRKNTIISGLLPVFELSRRSINRILKERIQKKFKNVFDFLQRINPEEREAVNLAKCGAFRSMEKSETEALAKIRIFYRNKKKISTSSYVTKGITLPPYSTEQRVINELEILRYAVSAHPLSLFNEINTNSSITGSRELEEKKNQTVKVAGWLVTMRRAPSKKGGYMTFVTIEDQYGLIECVLFPDVYQKFGKILKGYGPYIIFGKVQSRVPGEANVIVEKVYQLKNKKVPEVKFDKIPESY